MGEFLLLRHPLRNPSRPAPRGAPHQINAGSSHNRCDRRELGANFAPFRNNQIMKSKTILISLAALLPAAFIHAQEPGGPPPGDGPGRGHGHRPPPPIVEALDANHDGVISADEIANAPAALKTLDKNGDGQLTPDELRPPPPADAPPPPNAATTGTAGNGPDGENPPPPPPHHPQKDPLIEALDVNHDGIISADEINNAAAALKTLDKNGDGQLTPDEFCPPRPPKGPPPPPPQASGSNGAVPEQPPGSNF